MPVKISRVADLAADCRGTAAELVSDDTLAMILDKYALCY